MLGTTESPSLPDAAATLRGIFITRGRGLEERGPDPTPSVVANTSREPILVSALVVGMNGEAASTVHSVCSKIPRNVPSQVKHQPIRCGTVHGASWTLVSLLLKREVMFCFYGKKNHFVWFDKRLWPFDFRAAPRKIICAPIFLFWNRELSSVFRMMNSEVEQVSIKPELGACCHSPSTHPDTADTAGNDNDQLQV